MDNKEIILKDCEIPAVPIVAMKILKLVEEQNISVDALQDVIMGDQSLAARVLKSANSSFYGSRRNIDTISEAIIMMGFNTIKNLALAVSTRDVYRKFGLLEQKMWEHSLGVSVAAGLIAKETRSASAEEATVAGLLHDVGKVVMNNSHPEKFALMTEIVYNERVTYVQKEKSIFGFGHAEVGGIFSHNWGFPESLCDVIRRHHFESYDDLLDLEPPARNLCCVVALADGLCVRLGVGYRGPMADIALRNTEYMALLNINEEQMEDLTARFKQLYIEEKMGYQG